MIITNKGVLNAHGKYLVQHNQCDESNSNVKRTYIQ
jgi:hypothetical protein